MTVDRSATIIAELRAQLEERDEEIRQLKDAAAPILLLPHGIGLTRQEAQLLGTLYVRAGQYVHRESVALLLDRPLRGEADPKGIDVLTHRLRKKLSSFGIVISATRGRGYCLPPDSVRLLRALIAAERERAAA